jgi:hypothetical protein
LRGRDLSRLLIQLLQLPRFPGVRLSVTCAGTGAATCSGRGGRSKVHPGSVTTEGYRYILRGLLHTIAVAMGSGSRAGAAMTSDARNIVATHTMSSLSVGESGADRTACVRTGGAGSAVTGVTTAGGVAHRRRLGVTRHAVRFYPSGHRIG